MLRLSLPHRRVAVVVCLLVFLMLPTVLRGQATTGTLGGTVYDPNHAVIPNARIVALNNATESEFIGYSDARGNYTLSDLPPGTYSVDISAGTFTAYTALDVTVELGRRTRLDTTLEIRASTSTVQVHAIVPLMDVTYPSIATNITHAELLDLPSDSRRWSSFALLTPGVVSGRTGRGLLSFRGVSVLLNNNTVNGVDNNDAFYSGERGGTRAPYSISLAAVQQFQVNTANYSAEYGRSAGGVINTVTRSGTNHLHGQIFFYDRNSDLAATNPYTTLTHFDSAEAWFVTSPYRPLDVRKQYGFGIGGPILKDRLFWFYSFDRHVRDFPVVSRVGYPAAVYGRPLATLPSGTYLGFPITCANLPPYHVGTSPYSSVFQYEATQGACEMYDHLDLSSYSEGVEKYRDGLAMIGSLTGVAPRTGSETLNYPKIDWQINDRNHATISYDRMRWSSPNGVERHSTTQYGVNSLGDDFTNMDWGIVRLTTFLTENLSNEIRVQLSRELRRETAPVPAGAEIPLSRNQYGLAPQISIGGGAYGEGMVLGTPAKLPRPEYPNEHRTQVTDTVSWVAGNHLIKIGADWDRNADRLDSLYGGVGKYYYTAFANFLADYDHAVYGLGPPHVYIDAYAGYSQSFGPPGYFVTTNDFAGFVNDEWRIHPRVNLTAGVRYEYERTPQAVFINPQLPQTANYPDDRDNIAPRAGVAWDIFGNGRTVVRAGAGMFYGRISNHILFSVLTSSGSPETQRSYRYSWPLAPGAPQFPSIFFDPPTGAERGSKPSAYFFAKNYQAPESMQGNLTVEQQVGWNTAVSLSYLTSQGRELPNYIDTNIDNATVGVLHYTVDIPGPAMGKPSPLAQGAIYTTPLYTGIRPNHLYGNITEVLSNVNSNYNAGVLKVNHRTTHGLHFGLSYTWAHALDDHENAYLYKSPTNILQPNNMALEYGNSRTDIRQRLVVYGSYRTRWRKHGWLGYVANDWSLAPVVAWQTGLPYTLGIGGSAPGGAFYGVNGGGGPSRLNIHQRNSYRFPSTQTTRLRVSRHIPVRSRVSLELMAEVYNLTNTLNVTQVDTLGYNVCSSPFRQGCPADSTVAHPYLEFNPTYGVVTNANSTSTYTPREIQLAVRLKF